MTTIIVKIVSNTSNVFDVFMVVNLKLKKTAFDACFSWGSSLGFFNGNAIEFYDSDHSETEDRYPILGLSNKVRILVVSYTLMEDRKA